VGKTVSSPRKIDTEQRAKVFKARSDPTRLRMIEMLANCDRMCGTEIANSLGISLALLSHHWKPLEHAGLITKKKEGQTASISLNRELLSACFCNLID
jgi:DNA-binding transcriptional ArsR family regulator